MKKKLIVILMILSIISLVGVVQAGELNQGDSSADVKVSLSVGQQYVITIPESFTLPADGTSHEAGTVKITSLTLIPTETLNVYVKSTNGWYVIGTDETSSTNKIAYQLTCSGDYNYVYDYEDEDALCLIVSQSMATFTNHQGTLLSFQRTGHVPTYGTYADTLTFSVEII